jgi:4-hydroxy-tetrahydrodipicolinate reductase
MGRTLIEAVQQDAGATLAAALEHGSSPFLGKDAGELVGAPCGVRIVADLDAALARFPMCLIDFTRPEGTLQHIEACRRHKVSLVIGTTGFSAEGQSGHRGCAQEIPIVFAPNMAVGVNAVFRLLDVAARILNEGYDIEVIEAHHRHKVDAPSGTALRMGEVVARRSAAICRMRRVRPRRTYRRAAGDPDRLFHHTRR